MSTPQHLGKRSGAQASSGYRLPAEFEPQSRVWLTTPHNPDTWPGCLDEAQTQFESFTNKLAQFVEVKTTQSSNIETNDSWIRDYGPIFVMKENEIVIHDFTFNAWGNKCDDHELDNIVPQHIARKLNLPIWIHDFVLEGGSIDTNGRGTLLTTEQCLLNPNRNPSMSRDQIEQQLHSAFGTTNIIWLPDGIEGDDTDGHVDDVARFIDPHTIAAVRANESHPDHTALERNWQTLTNHDFNLVELPAPNPILFDYPKNRYYDAGPQPLPASYANFVITNNAVIVPTFGQTTDDIAIRTLEHAMPSHKVIGLRAEHLIVGRGAYHCLSMHEPTP